MSSKRFGLVLVTSVLSLVSAVALAAPPAGAGGGKGGKAAAGDVSERAELDHASGGASGAGSHGASVSEKLTDNTKLASKIEGLTGQSSAQTACTGFKSLGACVSAAHVSKNLNIPFDTLRSKVTGSGAVSLGQAIHELKPDADAKGATTDADKQTKEDMKSSG
jgi:hypothetical protein